MTKLDELQAALDAATAANKAYQASPSNFTTLEQYRSERHLNVMAVNALPDLIALARAAQRYLNGHSGADGVALHAAVMKLTGGTK